MLQAGAAAPAARRALRRAQLQEAHELGPQLHEPRPEGYLSYGTRGAAPADLLVDMSIQFLMAFGFASCVATGVLAWREVVASIVESASV